MAKLKFTQHWAAYEEFGKYGTRRDYTIIKTKDGYSTVIRTPCGIEYAAIHENLDEAMKACQDWYDGEDEVDEP